MIIEVFLCVYAKFVSEEVIVIEAAEVVFIVAVVVVLAATTAVQAEIKLMSMTTTAIMMQILLPLTFNSQMNTQILFCNDNINTDICKQ